MADNTFDGVRRVRVLSPEETDTSAPLLAPAGAPLFTQQLRRAILATRNWLLGEQHHAGYFEAELEGDTILESEYVLLLAFLSRHQTDHAKKAAKTIEMQQLVGGGWAIYPGGPVDISASVKAYFAMKLTGSEPSSEPMCRARAAILAHGGVDAVNSFTRFYLAMLGQISYEHCPAVPPEALLLPNWLPINIYRVSAWSRTILVPLSIISAHRPVRELPPSQGIQELFLKKPSEWPSLRSPGVSGGTGLISWDRFFRVVDRAFKFLQRRGWLPLRKRAIDAAKHWMIERFDGSAGLGAIFPPMIWSIVALHVLDYDETTPEWKYCWEHLDGLIIEEFDSLRLQPCRSPVWDTAITLRALSASGLEADHAAIQRGVEWLLKNEVRREGDWSRKVKVEPGGWCFEHANEFYPDVDDTIMVMMALASQLSGVHQTSLSLPPGLTLRGEPATLRMREIADGIQCATSEAAKQLPRNEAVRAACDRGLAWVLAMQNQDGGWGAFDKDNDSEWLCYVPFADHNAMIDPSTPDLTGRVLEMLGHFGRGLSDPAVMRAVNYLRQTQQADGSWFGRWGVNYIYGTWQVLLGLEAVGMPKSHPLMESAAQWLLSHQQPCGGWGESPDSYADPRKRGQGNPTASQTAWAVWGLLAAGKTNHPAMARGVNYLLETQAAEGIWPEPEYTGTGFPLVFYLRYHWYPIYFPLLALSRYAAELEPASNNPATPTSHV
jgi:squalene-hopene/tetraprenyl-beta-curcumene cyclase